MCYSPEIITYINSDVDYLEFQSINITSEKDNSSLPDITLIADIVPLLYTYDEDT